MCLSLLLFSIDFLSKTTVRLNSQTDVKIITLYLHERILKRIIQRLEVFKAKRTNNMQYCFLEITQLTDGNSLLHVPLNMLDRKYIMFFDESEIQLRKPAVGN